jgi:hypothetical protein
VVLVVEELLVEGAELLAVYPSLIYTQIQSTQIQMKSPKTPQHE